MTGKTLTFCIMCAAAIVFSSGARAIDDGASSNGQPAGQSQTEAWLKVQAKGSAASAIPQTSTAVERDLSLQRWLETYKHEIPAYYDQKAGGSVSSGK
ncbi:DUF3613 domain-containing protein [Pseudomonas alliivorans]|nr:DUF3613 domain-containing protein [Pseudomonas alliivorans]